MPSFLMSMIADWLTRPNTFRGLSLLLANDLSLIWIRVLRSSRGWYTIVVKLLLIDPDTSDSITDLLVACWPLLASPFGPMFLASYFV